MNQNPMQNADIKNSESNCLPRFLRTVTAIIDNYAISRWGEGDEEVRIHH